MRVMRTRVDINIPFRVESFAVYPSYTAPRLVLSIYIYIYIYIPRSPSDLVALSFASSAASPRSSFTFSARAAPQTCSPYLTLRRFGSSFFLRLFDWHRSRYTARGPGIKATPLRQAVISSVGR